LVGDEGVVEDEGEVDPEDVDEAEDRRMQYISHVLQSEADHRKMYRKTCQHMKNLLFCLIFCL
jgi:hypothetical protein